jgi:hypothetical protein
MELVDLPPLTARAAFEAVALEDVNIVVAGPVVLLTGSQSRAVAERMYAWADDWVDSAVASVFMHPARRRP